MKLGRTLVPVVSFAALAVVVAVVPSFVSAFRAQQLAYVGIYLIAIIGLNVLTGYTGQISLGHGAFMAVGGYTTAILMADHGVKDVWTIPLAGLVAGTAGFLFGIPALRLSGLYLALLLRRQHSENDALQERARRLSPREREVFALTVTGLLNKQAAAQLGISEVTYQIHRGQVMRKMEAGSFAELVRMAMRLGIGLQARDNPGASRL